MATSFSYPILTLVLLYSLFTFGQSDDPDKRNYRPETREELFVDFPDPENWKIIWAKLENSKNATMVQHFDDGAALPAERLYRAFGEQADFDSIVNTAYQRVKEQSPGATLDFVEKDLRAQYPWKLYLMQNIDNEVCHCKESQMWYFIKGKAWFHETYRSVSGASVSDALKAKLIRFLKKYVSVSQEEEKKARQRLAAQRPKYTRANRENGFYAVLNTSSYEDYELESLQLAEHPVINESGILALSRQKEKRGNNYQVVISLTQAAGKQFRAMTIANIGKPIAIVLGKKILMAPVVAGEIPDGKIAVGNLSEEDAAILLDTLEKAIDTF